MGSCISIAFLVASFLVLVHSNSCAQEVRADATVGKEDEIDDAFGDEFDDEFADEFEDENELRRSDPLRLYNRFMFQVNDKLYFWVMKPVASGYRKVVPEKGRVAVGRFFRNLLFPVRFVNNVLQLKFKNAGGELARFGINSTIGILGFGDPAKSRLGLDACNEDFGQTLGRYGVGSGPPLVLPVLGSSNLRDAIGKVPDYFLNPIHYVEPEGTAGAIRAYEGENYISLHIGEYESLKKEAIDPYTFMRDVYEQSRKKVIKE